MVGVEQIQSEYPLHWLVWNNEYKALEIELEKNEVNTENNLLIFVCVCVCVCSSRNANCIKFDLFMFKSGIMCGLCENLKVLRVWCLLVSFLVNLQHDKEKKDCRGRTPLMLAITLGHLESARILLNHEANVSCENADGWTGNHC